MGKRATDGLAIPDPNPGDVSTLVFLRSFVFYYCISLNWLSGDAFAGRWRGKRSAAAKRGTT